MAKFLRALLLVSTVHSYGYHAFAEEVTAQAKPVIAQNISDNVLWTRRTDRYTLQIMTNWRPAPTDKGTVPKPLAARRRELPDIEVSLLRIDGAAILPIQRWQTPASKAPVVASRQPRAEVLYAYPLSAGAEAVTVVICTDGDCLVRKIAPFPN
jgi:hypothetical protein